MNLKVERQLHGEITMFYLINETYATRCQTLRLKCTKFDFLWGSAPYSMARDGGDPLAVVNRSYVYF